MTTAPPTRAVANLHLHLEYDSGLDVIAAAMATIPEGDEDSDEHRGHVAGDISSAVAHLLDIEAIAPEGCPIRVTEVSMEVSVDLEEPEDLEPADPTPEEFAELREEVEGVFGRLGLTEVEEAALAQAQTVDATTGQAPFHLRPANLLDTPRFIVDWGLVCGYFARACEYVVDCLFDDLAEVSAPRVPGVEPPLTDLAGSLPEQWEREYTPLFYRKFIVVTTGVTARIVAGWDGPASIAEALATSYLVGLVGELAEIEGIELRDDMLAVLEERVVPSQLVNDVLAGDDPMLAFPYWFVPFDDEVALAPYATDYLD